MSIPLGLFQEMHRAILTAFSGKESLIEMLRTHLPDALHEAKGSTTRAVALNLLVWADKHQRMEDLWNTLKASLPNTEVNRILARLRQGVPTSASSTWGESPAEVEQFEKILAASSTLVDVNYLDKGVRAARAVVLLRERAGQPIASGFLSCVKSEGKRYFVVITNNHVINSSEQAQGMEALFNYQKTENGHDAKPESVPLRPDLLFATAPRDVDDWTVVALEQPKLDLTQPLRLEGIEPVKGTPVNIIQHPGGGMKQLSSSPSLVTDVDLVTGRVQYLTDTDRGSSGSPVFDPQWRVVALHHKGAVTRLDAKGKVFYRNQGILITRLLDGMQKEGIFPSGED